MGGWRSLPGVLNFVWISAWDFWAGREQTKQVLKVVRPAEACLEEGVEGMREEAEAESLQEEAVEMRGVAEEDWTVGEVAEEPRPVPLA